jgi:hypothetical protein
MDLAEAYFRNAGYRASAFATLRPRAASRARACITISHQMRKVILKDFPREVDYVTEQPPQLPVRIKAEQQGGTHTIDVVGALHGELQPLVPTSVGTGLGNAGGGER